MNTSRCKYFIYYLLKSYLILIFILSLIVSVIPLSTHLICGRIPGLRPQQKRICEQKPQSLPIIISGLRMAAQECQRQFRYHRWNCSLIPGHNIFTNYIIRGTREASYYYALRSAGVTYAISEACSRGNLSFCGCYQMKDVIKSDSWQWSGCNTNIDFGIKLSKQFIDSEDFQTNLRSLMNLHNNKVGRKSVRDLLISRCKCHGVSGSCSARTCWKTLPSFTTIGDNLMKKYENARRVTLNDNRKFGTKTENFLKLKTISSNERIFESLPKPRDLVYYEKSVNYCDKNPLADSLGTFGRFCNKTSNASDGCPSMCCGRGYNTHRFITKWKCGCIFHFCCSVNCQECSKPTEQYSCK